jgi:3-phosphoglycerate kinase
LLCFPLLLLLSCCCCQQGRPKSGPEDKFRLTPIAPRLSELLGKPVKKLNDCIGDEVKQAVADAKEGEVCVGGWVGGWGGQQQ